MISNTQHIETDLSHLSISHPTQSSPPNPSSESITSTSDPSPSKTDADPHAATVQDSDEEIKPRTSAEVLNEFDPLADSKEVEARQAWESSEGHPMSPNPPLSSPSADTSPQQGGSTDTEPAAGPSTPPGIGAGFSTIANFARSFSIPKVRTRSVDIAPPPNVITPNTLSSFAAQQQSRSSTPAGTAALQGESQSINDAPNPAADTTSSNSRRDRARQKDEPPPFDFQLFLDQMKSKSAEPVAKYLRS